MESPNNSQENQEQNNGNTEQPEKTTNRRKSPLAIRTHGNSDEEFREAAKQFESQEEYLKFLLDLHKNPPEPIQLPAPDPIVKEKELLPNQVLLNLDEDQFNLVSLVQKYRLKTKTKGLKINETAEMETKEEIFIGSFFHRSRLLNLDSNYITGIPQNALD